MATEKKPAHWDKRVSAAYLRILGMTQEQTAKAVGRCERTIWGWEQEPSWENARREASDRWLNDVVDASRTAVLNQIRGGDGNLGFTVLERTDERLLPAKQRLDLGGDAIREIGQGLTALIRDHNGHSNETPATE